MRDRQHPQGDIKARITPSGRAGKRARKRLHSSKKSPNHSEMLHYNAKETHRTKRKSASSERIQQRREHRTSEMQRLN